VKDPPAPSSCCSSQLEAAVRSGFLLGFRHASSMSGASMTSGTWLRHWTCWLGRRYSVTLSSKMPFAKLMPCSMSSGLGLTNWPAYCCGGTHSRVASSARSLRLVRRTREHPGPGFREEHDLHRPNGGGWSVALPIVAPNRRPFLALGLTGIDPIGAPRAKLLLEGRPGGAGQGGLGSDPAPGGRPRPRGRPRTGCRSGG
jgi:hypothetical protein